MYFCLYTYIFAGDNFRPSAYSLDLALTANGSIHNGGCPTVCVGTQMTILTCNCPVHAGLSAYATTGASVDGIVRPIDVTESNDFDQYIWAASLFTMRGRRNTARLYVQFETSLILRAVEFMLFHCLPWGIGAETINVYNSEGAFLTFMETMINIGSFSFQDEPEGCEEIIAIPIPLTNEIRSNSYVIEFANPSGSYVKWIYIAEMKFSDIGSSGLLQQL